MDDKQLQETFRRAAEIASVVPESMHQAAFNRALDALMGTTQPASPGPTTPTRTTTPKAYELDKAKPADPVADLMAMERSRAAEVDDAQGALAKALALLLVARRELSIDGLTPTQMASVLTDKFRWRVTRQAINQAMDTAGNRVDRVKGGRGSRYRLMQAGETWLATPTDERKPDAARAASGGGRAATRRRRKAKGATNPSSVTEVGTGAGDPPSKPSSVRRPSRGPKAAVESLIDSGWFKTPRGLSAIRTELEHRLALRFKPTDLSPAMTRLLREGRLRRSKTEAGQYEYES